MALFIYPTSSNFVAMTGEDGDIEVDPPVGGHPTDPVDPHAVLLAPPPTGGSGSTTGGHIDPTPPGPTARAHTSSHIDPPQEAH